MKDKQGYKDTHGQQNCKKEAIKGGTGILPVTLTCCNSIGKKKENLFRDWLHHNSG